MAHTVRLRGEASAIANNRVPFQAVSAAQGLLAICIVHKLTTRSVRPSFTRLFGPYSQYSHHKAKDIYKLIASSQKS